MTSEQVPTSVDETQPAAPAPKGGRRRPRWFAAHRAAWSSSTSSRFLLVPAVPQGGPAGRRLPVSRVLHRRHARVPGAAHRCFGPTSPGATRWSRSRRASAPRSSPCGSSCLRDHRRLDHHDPRAEAHPGPRPELLRVVLRVHRRLRRRVWPVRPARPYIPLFVAFFLLIIFSNWIGLIPLVGRVEALRAPSSDVNITLGLALVAFVDLRDRGLPQARLRRLPGEVLPALRVQERASARASSPCSSGLVELMLEFVKPMTLSMRLFGNIYGGEVALGVITALTIAIIPVALSAWRSCSTRSRP